MVLDQNTCIQIRAGPRESLSIFVHLHHRVRVHVVVGRDRGIVSVPSRKDECRLSEEAVMCLKIIN